MPSARLSRARREELLTKLRNGHDLEAAAAALGIGGKQIDAAGAKLAGEIGEAFKIGTSRLRSRLLELSLSNQDASALARLFDKREQQAEAVAPGITLIRHEIVSARCPHCGKRPVVRDGEGKVRQFHPRGNGNGSKRASQ